MNLIEFSKILRNPNLLNKEESESLENVLQEFPYFQSARILYLSSLKKQSSFKYNAALKKTAAFTTDRSILFDFITTDEFVMENYISKDTPKKEIKNNNRKVSKKTTEQVSDSISEEKGTVTTETSKESLPVFASNKDKKTLPLGKPIAFKKDDSFSFNEWLNITSMTPLRDDHAVKKQPRIKPEKEDLINKFITANPKIKPSGSSDITDYSHLGSMENENLMTETLAHVYLEQKKYTKAITAFRILSLKYPKKSSFFANQIEEIENLQKNKS